MEGKTGTGKDNEILLFRLNTRFSDHFILIPLSLVPLFLLLGLTMDKFRFSRQNPSCLTKTKTPRSIFRRLSRNRTLNPLPWEEDRYPVSWITVDKRVDCSPWLLTTG